MNQSELILSVAQVSGESKKTVEQVLKTASDVIHNALVEGRDVTLLGLGKLHVKTSAARTGRNPQTGESMAIPAKNGVKLTVAKALKDAMNPAAPAKKGKK